MNLALLSAVAVPAGSSLLGLLFWVAILAVVVWAVVALIRHMGITIPYPVQIVFWALLSIALIVLLFRLFGAVM
jgi:hypothetical protein